MQMKAIRWAVFAGLAVWSAGLVAGASWAELTTWWTAAAVLGATVSATYGITVQGGGLTIQRSIVRSADHPNPYVATIGAATAGTLSTRTDDDTGDITLSAGHGLTDGTYDVFWTDGNGVRRVHYGTTATIVTNTMSIDGGSGDALPAQDSAVVVCKRVNLNTMIDGDAAKLVVLSCEYAALESSESSHFVFVDNGAAVIAAELVRGNQPRVWDIEGGDTNDFTGNPIVDCYVTHANTAASATIKILSMETAAA